MQTRKHTNAQMNAQIYSEASEWLVEFRSGDIDAAGRAGFLRWLRSSPEHMRAYLELAAIWNEGSALDAARVFDDAALLEQARTQTNVLPLDVASRQPAVDSDQPPPSPSQPSPRAANAMAHSREPTSRSGAFWRRHTNVAGLAAMAASILVAVGAWNHLLRGVYSTEIGEQRTLALSDGSRIELNALSKVRIRYNDTTRLIELLSGQAFFHVAKDKARALIVVTADTRIRAVGTKFDVYRKQSGTTVAVVEGKVAVDSPRLRAAASSGSSGTLAREAHATALFLIAGEQVTVNAHRAPRIESVNGSSVTAWTQGRLVFQGTALQEVAEEFNRYNKKPLVIRDPELAAFRITGIFSSTEPSSLIRFLDARSDISVTEGSDEISVHR